MMKPYFGEFAGKWHRWFAWRPVYTYDRRFVWLKMVWRCNVQLHDYLYNPYPSCKFWWWYQLEQPGVERR